MKRVSRQTICWENDEVRVTVPYTVAGVSTTVVIDSKFTGKTMLIDVGDGALRDLLKAHTPSSFYDIENIAISHGHFDHIGGLYALLGFMRLVGRTASLNVLMPKGCLEVSNVIGAFKSSYRETVPFRIMFHDLLDGTEFFTDFFKVQAFGVEHSDVQTDVPTDALVPALSFRVQVGQTVVGYSGDTRLCPGVEMAVRDVDFALIEATHRQTVDAENLSHISERDARRLGRLAKEYALIHRIPEAWIKETTESP